MKNSKEYINFIDDIIKQLEEVKAIGSDSVTFKTNVMTVGGEYTNENVTIYLSDEKSGSFSLVASQCLIDEIEEQQEIAESAKRFSKNIQTLSKEA